MSQQTDLVKQESQFLDNKFKTKFIMSRHIKSIPKLKQFPKFAKNQVSNTHNLHDTVNILSCFENLRPSRKKLPEKEYKYCGISQQKQG